jgi:predicted transcriptional regulator
MNGTLKKSRRALDAYAVQDKIWNFIYNNPGHIPREIAEATEVSIYKIHYYLNLMELNNYLFYAIGNKFYPMEHLLDKKESVIKSKKKALLPRVETCGVGGSYMIENGVPRWI